MYNLTNLFLYLTGNCNLRCRHCWIDPSFGKDDPPEEISLEYLEKAIVEAKELGLRRVKLSGGEPLLRKDITGIFDIVSREGLTLDMETNGTLMDENIAASLSRCKRGTVAVSLDSADPDSHDAFRGVKGAFSKTVNGLRNLRDHNIPFQIIVSLYKKNTGELGNILETAAELGASSLKINPVSPYGRGVEIYEKGENLTVSEVLDIGKKLEQVYKARYKFPIMLCMPVAFNSFDNFRRGRVSSCHILNILGILHDGTVSFCGIGKMEKELVMGNIKTDSIKDIWRSSPILARMREDIPDRFTGICSKCMFKRICLGKCVAMTYAMKRNFTDGYWFCEMAREEGLFPSTRMIEQEKSNVV